MHFCQDRKWLTRAYFNDFFATSGLQIAADAEGRVFGSTLVANIANQDCGGLVASSDTKPANVAICNILPIPAPATATTAII